MERETGIEPATSSLGSWRSTAELLPLKHSLSAYYHRSCASKPHSLFISEPPLRLPLHYCTAIIRSSSLPCALIRSAFMCV